MPEFRGSFTECGNIYNLAFFKYSINITGIIIV